MQSPRHDREHEGRSTGSSTIIRASRSDSGLDDLDAIHSVQVDGHVTFDMDNVTPLTVSHHHLMKSPRAPSIAPTMLSVDSNQKHKYRVLGTTSLIAILYLSSCGGPTGSEEMMSTAGPLIGLIAISLYIVLCQIPIVLMVTELCCAFPENGGYAVWVMTAFNPYWGFQVGYWSYIASLINNSTYPGIIYDAITDAAGVKASSGAIHYLCKVGIALFLAVPPFLGPRFMGFAGRFAILVVLVVGVMFSIWCFSDGEHAWFLLKETKMEPADESIDWAGLLQKIFWSFDGLHWISMVGGEVINPARTYPRVLGFTAMLTGLSYLLVTIAAVSADAMPWRKWEDGSYSTIGRVVGGSFLSNIWVVASVTTYGGLFACTMFFQSYLIQGMAQSQLLPNFLRKRNARTKAPQYALLMGLCVTIALSSFKSQTMINMANAFSSSVQVTIVATILQLRRAFPYLPRPMRIPGNTVTLALMLLAPTCVFIFSIANALKNWESALVIVAFAIPGLLVPKARQYLAGHRLCSW